MALVFITHDLAVVEHIADRVAVMYLGRIVEAGPADEVLSPAAASVHAGAARGDPASPTRVDGCGRVPLAGEIPSPIAPPAGCHFHPRCPLAVDRAAASDAPASSGGFGPATIARPATSPDRCDAPADRKEVHVPTASVNGIDINY